MQLDDATYQRYETFAPELLPATAISEATGERIMRRGGDGVCVKLQGGLCGIEAARGSDFLSDACHFYPRATRRLGELMHQSATGSCPEILRLATTLEDSFSLYEGQNTRLPASLRDYLSEQENAPAALQLHMCFVNSVLTTEEPLEAWLMRLNLAMQSLQSFSEASWPEMAEMALKFAPGRIPAPQTDDFDQVNLLHLLVGLTLASRQIPTPRLLATMAEMEAALGVRVHWQNGEIESIGPPKILRRLPEADAFLRRWLALQLSLTLFPYSGLGEDAPMRASFLAIRFALVRLALSAHVTQTGTCELEAAIRVAQSISRVLDHLGDAHLFHAAAYEMGWLKLERLHGLLAP